MIERAYIQIDGPPKGGKTTLVEHVLKTCKNELLLATRFLPAKRPKDAGPAKGNDETKRYQDAGAIGAMVFRVTANAGPEDFESFWSSELIENYSRGIVIEGAVSEEVVAPDLVVFVIRPLSEGEALLVKGARAPRQIDREGMEIMERVLFRSDPKRVSALQEFERLIPSLGLTPRGSGWAIRPDCSDITKAAVVVINVHHQRERLAADKLAAEIRRIREDPEVKDDVIGLRDARRQPAILVANLADPKDKELKKAVSRVRKVIATRSRS